MDKNRTTPTVTDQIVNHTNNSQFIRIVHNYVISFSVGFAFFMIVAILWRTGDPRESINMGLLRICITAVIALFFGAVLGLAIKFRLRKHKDLSTAKTALITGVIAFGLMTVGSAAVEFAVFFGYKAAVVIASLLFSQTAFLIYLYGWEKSFRKKHGIFAP